jgi:predicted amidophosphoribosyltransferase
VPLLKCPKCEGEVSSIASVCPKCGLLVRTEANPGSVAAPKSARTAGVKKRSSFAGGGCALQALGFISLLLAAVTLLTVIGPIFFGVLGLWLLSYGTKKAGWLECSACGGKLSNGRVAICPHCSALLNESTPKPA